MRDDATFRLRRLAKDRILFSGSWAMVAKKSTQQVKRSLVTPPSASKIPRKTPVKVVVLTCPWCKQSSKDSVQGC